MLVEDILTQILITLLTFITLLILSKVSICCCGCFLSDVSYYVNFQFTIENVEEWPMGNNMVSKICLKCLLIIFIYFTLKSKVTLKTGPLNDGTSLLNPEGKTNTNF